MDRPAARARSSRGRRSSVGCAPARAASPSQASRSSAAPSAPRASSSTTVSRPAATSFILSPPSPGGAARNLTQRAHARSPRTSATPSSTTRRRGSRSRCANRPTRRACCGSSTSAPARRARVTRGARLPTGAGPPIDGPRTAPTGASGSSRRAPGCSPSMATATTPTSTSSSATGRSPGARSRRAPSSRRPSSDRAARPAARWPSPRSAASRDGYKGVVYRFPNDLHSEYHQHVGITLGDDITWHMRETADGDYVGLLLDRDAVWSAGALVHVDRNLGIELPTDLAPRGSLPGYRSPVSYLGPYGSHADALVDPYASEPAQRRVEERGRVARPATAARRQDRRGVGRGRGAPPRPQRSARLSASTPSRSSARSDLPRARHREPRAPRRPARCVGDAASRRWPGQCLGCSTDPRPRASGARCSTAASR